MDMKNMFWGGYRSADVSTVEAVIPIEGRYYPAGAVENFRMFSNMYYRLYNDGDRPSYSRMNMLAKRVGTEYRYYNMERDMERIGGLLLDAAVEELQRKDA